MHNIAIVGLGRVGGQFLEKMLALRGRGVHVVAVAEVAETAGRARAIEENIPLLAMEQIVALGEGVDVIFELTGSAPVRQSLREILAARENRYSILAPENVARLMWTVMGDEVALPDQHTKRGY